MRRRMRFVISGLCAVLAAVLCILYGRQVKGEAERMRAEALERYGSEVVTLVVASRGLEAGDVIDRQNVSERDWVSDLAPEGAVTRLEDVLGSEVTVPAAEGAPITSLNFRDDEDALDVPSGRVALSLPLTEKCALPGSATVGMALSGYEVTDSGARVVAQDLQLLRLPGDQGISGSRGSITVAASPEDVSRVLSASAEGSLRLALPADDLSAEDSLSGQAPTSVPAEEGAGETTGADEGTATAERTETDEGMGEGT